MRFETKVLSGLSVTVEFKPDAPEDWEVVEVNSKPINDPTWVYNRMTEADMTAMSIKCMDKVDAARDDELMEY